jgi:uncharacterized protein (DUF927 family)
MNNNTPETSQSFPYLDGVFYQDNGGIYWARQSDGKIQAYSKIWVCDPIQIMAMTRNKDNGGWGRFLTWRDSDNHPHEWAMPMTMLNKDGSDVRGALMSNGLAIATDRKGRELFNAYLSGFPVSGRITCVDKLGWYGNYFITHQSVIGASSHERVMFQSVDYIAPATSQQGTVSDWINSIGRYAIGNSRLSFAISLAFAPALLDVIDMEGGGFHLRGSSSAGKSTAQHVAASVWGRGSDYVRNWRVTSNAMEGMAVDHNDGLLVLDEISQIDPKHLAETSYMLANGAGKSRMSKSITTKPAAQWRLLMLSSGEESLSAILAKANIKTNVGQEVRLADIEADAGKGMGVIECLHDMPNSKELSDYLKRQASQHHGSVGAAWLQWVVNEREHGSLASKINDLMAAFIKWLLPNGGDGQVQRVATRFALVAVAGELATKTGLTGWDAEEASNGVKACFDSWLEGFGGTGNKESSNIINHVKGFIEAHGASRFEHMDGEPSRSINNRVGFYKGDGKGIEYMVMSESFKNALCNGYDVKTVIKVLREHNILTVGGDGRPTQKRRIGALGDGSTRVYVLRLHTFETGDSGDTGDTA